MSTSDQNFEMRNARSAMKDGFHIESQVDEIERAIIRRPGLVFDLAKTLVESVCRTILNERSISYSRKDNLSSLFRSVRQCLPFLPRTMSDETIARNSLEKILSGLQTSLQGVSELRNNYGLASHGSGESRSELESAQAQFAAEAADTIIGFLYRMHCQDRTQSTELRYEDNVQFNNYVDANHEPIEILGSVFQVSEVLFQMEPDTYRISLGEFNTQNIDSTDSVDE